MKSLCRLSTLLAVLIVSASAIEAQPLASTKVDARVQTVQFKSNFIKTVLPYNVILPFGYERSQHNRYPVLYLLHGLTGHYGDWITRTNLVAYADQYQMIVVTPEGNNGWYTDSTTEPADKYETYILEELMPDVDKRFRTIQARYARGVAGLSMGGYGAFKFGLTHPGAFVFVGSLSGAFEVTRFAEKDTPAGTAFYSVISVFGPPGSAQRKANDVFEMVRNLQANRIASLPYFYFDCGTEDFLFKSNRELDGLMLEKKVPHEFRELPGNHGWDYWDQQVQAVLKIAADKMRLPAAPTKIERERGGRSRGRTLARKGFRMSAQGQNR